MAYALRQGTDGRLARFDAATPLEVPGDLHILGQKELRFYEGANYVGFEAPALDADQIWILPTADGTSGQVLQTSGGGAGALSWVTKLGNVVEDTTPQLGGTLDCQNNIIDNAKTVSYNALGTGSGTGTVDWSSYQKYQWTISGAATLTFTAPSGPCNVVLKLINGGTGTISWPGTVLWPGGVQPTWTTSGTDVVAFFWDGTSYHGAASLDFS